MGQPQQSPSPISPHPIHDSATLTHSFPPLWQGRAPLHQYPQRLQAQPGIHALPARQPAAVHRPGAAVRPPRPQGPAGLRPSQRNDQGKATSCLPRLHPGQSFCVLHTQGKRCCLDCLRKLPAWIRVLSRWGDPSVWGILLASRVHGLLFQTLGRSSSPHPI